MPATTRRRRAAPRAADLLLSLYPFALVLLTLFALVAPQREGGAALAQVFAHYLFAPLLVLTPLALARGMDLLRIALVAAGATFLIVYPPANPLATPRDAEPDLTLMTWNLYVDGVGPAQLRAALEQHRPDIVALQEATLEEIAPDEVIAASYPYRVVEPHETAPGLAILSRYPILEVGVPPLDVPAWDMPRIVWVRIDLGGQAVTLVNAHPIPPRTFEGGCSLLDCYNSGPRDAQIVAVRRAVEELRLRTGDPIILTGDMNVTEREQAYFDLSAGLHDAHHAAGTGFGATWRPTVLPFPGALIRIDYVFTDQRLRPTALHTDCTRRGSDHCIVVAALALTPPPAPVSGR